MEHVPRLPAAQRLRISVLSDFDGPHARSWLRWFIARGHDVHAVSFYPARESVAGATMHSLRPRSHQAQERASPVPQSLTSTLRERMPRGVLRLVHGARYYVAGLRRLLMRIDPDVLQAHYVVEHGFYGALARTRPFVVTAWGSDVLVEPQSDPVSRLIARWTIARADLVTSNNAYMSRRIGDLGALPSKVDVITLGADRYDLELAGRSVNRAESAGPAPVIISTRAHEPLYNIDAVIDAYRIVLRSLPNARLVIANTGSRSPQLHQRAADLPQAQFVGVLDRATFREALSEASVFVSIPASDATSVALLQAMAAGAFPIVSDLPSQHELITHGFNGFRVRPDDPSALADRIAAALADPLLRRTAAEANLRLVEERGLNETQMAKLERHFYRLAGRSLPVESAIAR